MDERRRVSQRHERDVSRRSGSRLHAGSGSGSKKHDMHNRSELIENKTVLIGNRQITLKADDLKSLSYQADLQGREPVMHIRLAGRNWVLQAEEDYYEMRDKVGDK